jgi:hypothetical protein
MPLKKKARQSLRLDDKSLLLNQPTEMHYYRRQHRGNRPYWLYILTYKRILADFEAQGLSGIRGF